MPLTAEERAVLARCPLLQGAAETLLEQVAQKAETVQLSPGDTVYGPRKFRRCLGVLLSGQLQVTKGTLTVSILEPGELFGAAALYTDAPEFITTITSRRPGRCLLLEQELVDRLLEDPLIRRNYLYYLTGRVRFLSGRLQSLSQSGTEGKLVRYLLANGQSGSLTCPANDLAQRLGISRASLYRAFHDLEAGGVIRREGKTILIPSLSALEGYCKL